MIYRNKKLTDAAKGQQCTLDIPGICMGGTETTVACHSPLGEDRNGTKAPDFAAMDGCMHCHAVIDRREKMPDGDYIVTDEQRFYVHRAIMRTLANRFERGVLKC